MPRRSLTDRVTDSFRVLTELDISHAYERQAGTIALIALAVIVLAGVVVVRSTGGPARLTVPMDFPASGGLASGDPVLIRGVPVGRVLSVRLVRPGRVQVTTTLDPAYAPRSDATAEILALDLVGSQAVQYEPGTAPDPLGPGVAVVGAEPVTLTQQLDTLRERAGVIAVQLRGFDPEALRGDLARSRAALDRAQHAAGAFPADSVTAAMDTLFGEGRALLARLDALRAAFPASAIAAQRESLAVNAGVLMQQVGDVQARLAHVRELSASGEGSLGRFRRDSTLQVELEGVRRSLQRLQEKLLGRRPPPSP